MLGEVSGKLGPAARVLVLKLHPCGTLCIGLSGDLHAGVCDQRCRLCRLVVELLAFVGLGAIAASGDDEGRRPVGMGQTEMQRSETPHREADDMRLGDRQSVQHDPNVLAGAFLRITGPILRHVGRRVAARIVSDAAVAPREVAYLRLKAAPVVGKLVNKNDQVTRSGLLVIEADAVVGGEVWHRDPSAAAEAHPRSAGARAASASGTILVWSGTGPGPSG